MTKTYIRICKNWSFTAECRPTVTHASSFLLTQLEGTGYSAYFLQGKTIPDLLQNHRGFIPYNIANIPCKFNQIPSLINFLKYTAKCHFTPCLLTVKNPKKWSRIHERIRILPLQKLTDLSLSHRHSYLFITFLRYFPHRHTDRQTITKT